MTDDTYANEIAALESWERHLARLDNMIEDLPEGVPFSTRYSIEALQQSASIQVAARRNKLFPQEG